MKKFVTYEIDYSGEYAAMSEQEWSDASDEEREIATDCEWLWQLAPDKETAIKYHVLNYDRFVAMINAGLSGTSLMVADGDIPNSYKFNEKINMIVQKYMDENQ